MNYEQKIRQLEQELAHYKAIQASHRLHLDTHDEGFRAVEAMWDRFENNMLQVSEKMKELTEAQSSTQKLVDQLVRALLTGRGNGHSQEKPESL
jgi:chromosome segregation ATPase